MRAVGDTAQDARGAATMFEGSESGIIAIEGDADRTLDPNVSNAE